MGADVSDDGAAGEAFPAMASPNPPAWVRLQRLTIAVLVVALLVVGVLTWTSWLVYRHNENRLLDLKAKEAGSVLSAALPGVQTPLASAAELADATNGNPQQFEQLMAPFVGPGGPFVSASLWPLATPGSGPVATVGSEPALAAQPTQAAAFLSRTARSPRLSVTGILGSQNPRLGYEFNSSLPNRRFVAYAETALPPHRQSALAKNSAFSDLSFALYLGRSARPANLLEASVDRVPSHGAVAVVPFGDSAFTLVVQPRGSLSGTLSERLPWIIAVFGALLALAAAVTTERLVRRRRQAESLAGALDQVAEENRRLYTEQRTIAQTLQHALLPELLPDMEGIDSSSRYVPGVKGIDVGGDWYDLIAIDDRTALFVVGDVSGRGLDAAVVMASLRYAIRAYAAQGDAPALILTKLSDLVSVERAGHFATVLCAQCDIDRHEITVANAGHLPPLLICGDTAEFLTISTGLPVGVSSRPAYGEVIVPVPSGATLLAFTDGLVERRGENLDAGLQRLRDLAVGDEGSLEEFLTTLVGGLTNGGSDDDTALLGVRWHH